MPSGCLPKTESVARSAAFDSASGRISFPPATLSPAWFARFPFPRSGRPGAVRPDCSAGANCSGPPVLHPPGSAFQGACCKVPCVVSAQGRPASALFPSRRATGWTPNRWSLPGSARRAGGQPRSMREFAPTNQARQSDCGPD